MTDDSEQRLARLALQFRLATDPEFRAAWLRQVTTDLWLMKVFGSRLSRPVETGQGRSN